MNGAGVQEMNRNTVQKMKPKISSYALNTVLNRTLRMYSIDFDLKKYKRRF